MIRALAPWGSNLRPRPPGWYGRSGAKTENRVKTDGDISLFRIDTKRTETSRKAQEQRDKGSRCVFASKIVGNRSQFNHFELVSVTKLLKYFS